MKKIWLLPMLFFVILLVGCSELGANSKNSEGIVCNSPYIRFGEGCCLDQDNNKICDEDESNIKKEPEKENVTLQVTFVKIEGSYCNTDYDCLKQIMGESDSDLEEDPYPEDASNFFKSQIRCRNNVCEVSKMMYDTWGLGESFSKSLLRCWVYGGTVPLSIDEECVADSDCYESAISIGIEDLSKVKCE